MWAAASNLSQQMAHYLAVYFSAVPPRAADDGFRDLVSIGATIYQDGVPQSNIVSCVACHGPKCGRRGGDSSFGRVIVLLREKAA
jgi:cytochrome c553